MTLAPPGVVLRFAAVPPPAPPSSGVPAFLGADPGADRVLRRVDVGGPGAPAHGPLAEAVRGFFANGGRTCRIVAIDDGDGGPGGLAAGLTALEADEDVDLLCAPDLVRRRPPEDGAARLARVVAGQRLMLEHCRRRRDRFAVLDAVPGRPDAVRAHRRALAEGPEDGFGALYHPRVHVTTERAVPACGHVAGVFARTDTDTGPHRAPANVSVDGVVAPAHDLSAAAVDGLAAAGVNVLRVAPGGGVRIWGARTLAADGDSPSPWRWIGTRRLVIAMTRHLDRYLSALVFEPSEPRLWGRVTRDLTEYLDGLHRAGALHGATPAEAYSVRCDATNNPEADVRAGRLRVELGLALARPAEQIRLHVTRGPDGLTTS